MIECHRSNLSTVWQTTGEALHLQNRHPPLQTTRWNRAVLYVYFILCAGNLFRCQDTITVDYFY